MRNPHPSRNPLLSLYDGAAHAPFSWLEPDAAASPQADFVALTFDVSRGLTTCLDLVNASNLDRALNADGSDDDGELPVINADDTERLMRLSIAAARLLGDAAEREIARMNCGEDDR